MSVNIQRISCNLVKIYARYLYSRCHYDFEKHLRSQLSVNFCAWLPLSKPYAPEQIYIVSSMVSTHVRFWPTSIRIYIVISEDELMSTGKQWVLWCHSTIKRKIWTKYCPWCSLIIGTDIAVVSRLQTRYCKVNKTTYYRSESDSKLKSIKLKHSKLKIFWVASGIKCRLIDWLKVLVDCSVTWMLGKLVTFVIDKAVPSHLHHRKLWTGVFS